jgi:hypothetical protein
MLVKELVYSVLDLCKASGSDDSFWTEEFILFLCKKYRVFLIKKEQDKEKASQDVASAFETQQICLDLEKVPAIDGDPCTGGYYLRTTKPIPRILEGNIPRVYPIDYYQGTNISYVSRDKMRYIGSNPYLRNIIYSSIGPDLHMYLNSSNPQFLYLKKLRVSAVFEDFDEVSDLLCDQDGSPQPCDVLDMEFPIRQYMVPTLIELVVGELTKSLLRKEDTENNAKDDTPDVNRRQ